MFLCFCAKYSETITNWFLYPNIQNLLYYPFFVKGDSKREKPFTFDLSLLTKHTSLKSTLHSLPASVITIASVAGDTQIGPVQQISFRSMFPALQNLCKQILLYCFRYPHMLQE